MAHPTHQPRLLTEPKPHNKTTRTRVPGTRRSQRSRSGRERLSIGRDSTVVGGSRGFSRRYQDQRSGHVREREGRENGTRTWVGVRTRDGSLEGFGR